VAAFDDGHEAESDLLVGADGIYSRIRRSLNPDAAAPTYTGLVRVGGSGSSPDLQLCRPGYYSMYKESTRLLYALTDSTRLHWSIDVMYPESYPSPLPVSDVELAAVSDADWVRFARAMVHGISYLDALIANNSQNIEAHPIKAIHPAAHWASGPVVLIGDAAHGTPIIAQHGAWMAWDDAATLANCIRRCESVVEALRIFERLQRARFKDLEFIH
jgi:2-polyprenyl-6-methoxyphenol hydroxylase-like FAD-dependent oxidoreductase